MYNNINQVDSYLLKNCHKLNAEKVFEVRNAIMSLPSEKQIQIEGVQLNNPQTVLILAYFLGAIGVDRFMNGQVLLGILKLITCGGFLIWFIVDIFTAQKRTQIYNCNKILKAVQTIK